MPDHDASTAEQRITHENLAEEAHASEPQADGDSDSLQTNDSQLSSDALPALDGRESSLPPAENVPGDDPSADEAAIQKEAGQ